MYRMVRVQPSDQHLQRILWRDSPQAPVKTYELTIVTYGTACAPYLATKCLTQLGKDCQSTHPLGAEAIQKDFYVDDMLSGADDFEQAKRLMSEVIEVTDSAGFTLRKWNSNSAQLIANLPKHLKDDRTTLELDSSSATLSSDGLIHVGGRLLNASIPESRKHPFILNHHHLLTLLIMRHYHLKLFHAGQQLLIASVRERFWPTSIHSLARRVIHECIACLKNKPKVLEQLMADLPPERVTPSSPFLKVGVDYCGPFLISYPNRKARPVKCYVAIFVCLAVKAVHLELVTDLTTAAFLAALKRFVARRGKPQVIMCDNATTFVGAKRELMELYKLFYSQQFQESITKHAGSDGIDFRFIPPRSPNFGGLWEAQGKSFKTHFRKTIGLRTLNVDEMQTALAQIEAVLNSRPMTPVSSDPNNFEALTPGHFLVHRPLTAIPEPDLQDVPFNRLSMWQRAQSFTQQLW
ncbi:uncharacterized protein LOC129720107 [Wyeomyia smithii]|uniref:uncharacterized protein LOC129720107 n=1 Tax=Wyeomyia smithii TaxID=174621 RepID=UPI002467AC40|nr:uncharacterized protein LOC129720107 [Wyeomyia smithii]